MDALVARGMRCVTVVDISSMALDRAKRRLGAGAAAVSWIRADLTKPGWPMPRLDVWHDRGVFHFLTDAADQKAYLDHLRESLNPGGILIVGTFASDGPLRCSGLPVCRYSLDGLKRQLGDDLELLDSLREDHHTPGGMVQPFQWARFRRRTT